MLPKYFNEYKWSNIAAMVRNNSRTPKICSSDFRDNLVVITGATSGIGYHTARKFASHGARLLCINRNKEKSEALKAEIEKDFGVRCDYILTDLGNLKEVFDAAEKLRSMENQIDVLIHNAGIYLTKRELTPEGFDRVFVVHYLSSFVINSLLSEKLRSRGKARIIIVNSEGHRFAAWGLQLDDLNWVRRRYSGLKSYGSAKLAQLLSMLVFADYFGSSGVTINALHPGAVRSETGRDNGPVYRWFKKQLYDKMLRPTEISAEAIYYLGVSDETEGISGKFFNLTTEEEPAPPALDKDAARELWKKSVEMTGVKDIISKA
jgi:NAD(P)-dependent dehydrogenase (short-subunit alcohol dehydrogenase family)